MKIYKNDGTPYATEKAAEMQAKKKKLDGYKVIQEGDGWVIDDGKADSTPPLQAEPTHEEIKEPTVEFAGEFRPMRLLDLINEYRNPKFRYKWANTTMIGQIEKLKHEGWQTDHEMYNNLKHLSIYRDNTDSLDTTTRIREMLLMRMPKKLAESRNKYYQQRANAGLAGQEQEFNNAAGGATYGGIKVTRN
jgi:hypothetical protein